MLNLFQESFKRTNDSIILASPLVLFVLIIELYLNYAQGAISDIAHIIIAAITVVVITSGCMASWFYMVKKVLALSGKIFVFETDRGKALYQLLLSAPKGVGRLFLPFIGFITINIAIYYVLNLIVSYIVTKYIGPINYEWINLHNILLNPIELHDEIISLSLGENLPLSYWLCLMGIGSSVISFITILWIPEMVYSKKNVIISLITSVQKLIITLKKAFKMFLFIELLLVLGGILTLFLMDNVLLYFIVILFYYYLFIYIVVLLYSYYEQNFLK